MVTVLIGHVPFARHIKIFCRNNWKERSQEISVSFLSEHLFPSLRTRHQGTLLRSLIISVCLFMSTWQMEKPMRIWASISLPPFWGPVPHWQPTFDFYPLCSLLNFSHWLLAAFNPGKQRLAPYFPNKSKLVACVHTIKLLSSHGSPLHSELIRNRHFVYISVLKRGVILCPDRLLPE